MMKHDSVKFIAFSGGCFSGKTTTIKLAKKVFEKEGFNVITLDEILRGTSLDIKITSIDDIRKNAHEYLKLQNDIIRRKMAQELNAYASDFAPNSIVLADRAITDSLFYLLFYTDKSQLAAHELYTFEKLYNDIDLHAQLVFSELYDYILEFEPLNALFNPATDYMRPERLNTIKHAEHRMISTLNTAYLSSGLSSCKRLKINVNVMSKIALKDIFKQISNKFKYGNSTDTSTTEW